MSRLPIVKPLLAFSLLLFPAVAQAQTGFVYLRTNLVGDTAILSRGVLHTFLQQSGGGNQEVFTLEFPPGSYRFSKVVTKINSCYAEANGVSFDITANQFTTVDVPVAFTECLYEAVPTSYNGGQGSINITNGSMQPPVDCQMHFDPPTEKLTFLNIGTCHSRAPYGTSLFAVIQPAPGSFISGFPWPDTVNATADSLIRVFAENFQGLVNLNDTLPAPSDLGITRIGGSSQGLVTTGTFRVVNHGPGIAYDVHLGGWGNVGNFHLFGGATRVQAETSYGSCDRSENCGVGVLLPGESVDLTLHIEGIPSPSGGGNPTGTPYCDSVSVEYSRVYTFDTGLSNNWAPCTGNNVQVTVTTGGNPPPSVTVAKGTAAVPILQFILNPVATFTLDQITLAAVGTGNELVDVTAVKLYVDANGNGQVDSGDQLLASGTFASNNGTATLNVSPPFGVSAPTTFLVTYDFTLSLASRIGVVLFAGVIPVGLVQRKRRRGVVGLLLLLLVFGLSRCGKDSNGPGDGGDPTYQATLTGVTASGVQIDASVVSATVTVER